MNLTLSRSFLLLPGTGGGGFGAPRRTPTGKYLRGIVAGDFDGDGRMDVAVTTYDGFTLAIYRCPAGAFERILDLPQPAGGGAYSPGAADLDGDGKLDLLVPAFNENGIHVFRNR
jgi:hypothetical protein